MTPQFIKFSILLFLLNIGSKGFTQRIFINEIVANNGSINSDVQGDAPDWIEIYNQEDTTVNLQNYTLTDDPLESQKWVFPSKLIGPKSFIIVYASGKDSIFGQEELHTNFKISSSGEALYLYSPQGTITDQIGKSELERNQSYGRLPDGSSNLVLMDLPTPFKRNFESSIITPSATSGFFADSFLLALNSNIQRDTIYYTLDGSNPTKNDLVYSSPIMMNDRTAEPNVYSNIPTTPTNLTRTYWHWQTPENVTKSTTLKFRSFRGTVPSSKIYHQTYFIGEAFEDYTFPVFSLMIDSSALFDYDTGIYVPGAYYDSLGFSNWPIGNYHGEGANWERNGHIQFFESDKSLKFSTGVGLKMHGNGSLGLPQKNLRLLFKKKYGIGKLKYPIFESQFPNSFQRLLLRTGGNNSTMVNFLEPLLQDLLKEEDLDIQQYRPSILFINGEYWGIHNIREKMDEDYFASHYDIESDQIQTRFPCSQNDIGGGWEFLNIYKYLEDNYLEIDSNYQTAKEWLDVENIITYYIMQIFYANKDMHSNFRYWGTKGNRTKWRTVVYDLDISFGVGWGDKRPSVNHFEVATEEICHTFIFRKFLENQEFRDRFVVRSEEMLKTTFHSDTIINRFEQFKERYRPHIQKHIERWGYPESIEKWEELIQNFQNYARLRPCYYKAHLEAFFQIDSIDFNCNDTLVVSSTTDYSLRDKLSIYPNPTSNSITLKTNSANNLKNTQLNIYNIIGQKVFQEQLTDYRTEHSINVNHLQSGIYFVILIDRSGAIKWKEKLMIEN